MFVGQGGVCKICLRPPAPDRRLSVDHDHRTGAIRGLLCQQCNTLLGQVDDSQELLYRAITYLEEHKA